MVDEYGKQRYNCVYVDELPKSCISCPFLKVDNRLWNGETYIAVQWCALHSGKNYDDIWLESRWMYKRDEKCPLKTIDELPFVKSYESYSECYYHDDISDAPKPDDNGSAGFFIDDTEDSVQMRQSNNLDGVFWQ